LLDIDINLLVTWR